MRFREIVVELEKLSDYCLSAEHPVGKHKARVFKARLQFTQDHAPLLQGLLQRAAREREDDLVATHADQFGQRFLLDFEVAHNEARASIRSGWIVRSGEDVLRFTTCYVL